MVLSASPLVVAAFDLDFEKHLDAYVEAARANPKTTVLLQLGFEHETEAPADHLAEVVGRFRAAVPEGRVIALGNCEKECQMLGSRGVETRFIHQNCFLDERRFRPLPGPRRYAAAYIARLTPFKRHTLIPVELAPRLMLLGTKTREDEREYVETVQRRYAAARWIPAFSGAKVSEYLAQAKCGLVLSAREGASFCSSEYLLCGLPLVDTPALGGRSVLYPEEFVRFIESTPEAVAAGVEHWGGCMVDPWRVRAAWLEKAQAHRTAYRELMRELTGRTHARPPHKLGLRTPHPGSIYSWAIQGYLLMKAFQARLK